MRDNGNAGEERPGADSVHLTTGAFVRRSRPSPKALRLYEQLGLLMPDHIDGVNGYRRYRESQLATARLIGQLRRLGMPLAQIAEVVAADGEKAAALVASYWQEIERRTAPGRQLAAHIQIRLSGSEGANEMFGDVREREVPEQVVLTEQRTSCSPSSWAGSRRRATGCTRRRASTVVSAATASSTTTAR
ncbi:MAG TPA: MerR family transcriptional regulator [Mycobacteriales bacterium]|nr:MerR family transcriptional regulator [Mycobacteriales bacterium]